MPKLRRRHIQQPVSVSSTFSPSLFVLITDHHRSRSTGCCKCCQGWRSSGSAGSTSCTQCACTCRPHSSSWTLSNEILQRINLLPPDPQLALTTAPCPKLPLAQRQIAASVVRLISLHGKFHLTVSSIAATIPNGPSSLPTKKRDFKCRRPYVVCPHISGRGGLDCVDTKSDPEMCGGCINLGTKPSKSDGRDCTAVPNISVATCRKGECVIGETFRLTFVEECRLTKGFYRLCRVLP